MPGFAIGSLIGRQGSRIEDPSTGSNNVIQCSILLGGFGNELGHEPIIFHVGGARDFPQRDVVSNGV